MRMFFCLIFMAQAYMSYGSETPRVSSSNNPTNDLITEKLRQDFSSQTSNPPTMAQLLSLSRHLYAHNATLQWRRTPAGWELADVYSHFFDHTIKGVKFSLVSSAVPDMMRADFRNAYRQKHSVIPGDLDISFTANFLITPEYVRADKILNTGYENGNTGDIPRQLYIRISEKNNLLIEVLIPKNSQTGKCEGVNPNFPDFYYRMQAGISDPNLCARLYVTSEEGVIAD